MIDIWEQFRTGGYRTPWEKLWNLLGRGNDHAQEREGEKVLNEVEWDAIQCKWGFEC